MHIYMICMKITRLTRGLALAFTSKAKSKALSLPKNFFNIKAKGLASVVVHYEMPPSVLHKL